ncbi:MAG TPA: VWA domain-containing protein, partial [Vicinamibacterales bacterium]|nr:VWA domain-containing protein [Vicinamibacterales bacterium]
MRTRRAALTAAAIAVVGTGALVARPLPQGQDPTVFRGRVQSIEVDVRVTDVNGNAVRGLTKDDFTLLEDDKPQQIITASFVDLERESPVTPMVPGVVESDVATSAGVGRLWVILLGSTIGPGGRAGRARFVAGKFVQESLGPNDQVAVISIHGTMKSAQAFTRNRTLLLNAIERLDEEPPNPADDAIRTAYQVLEDVCNRLGRLVGRKAVLYFDPPTFFNIAGPPPAGSSAISKDVGYFFDQRDAIAAATRNNVAIYVVSTVGIAGATIDGSTAGGSLPPSTIQAVAGQRLLAEETGGDAIVNTNNYQVGYERFVQDSNQYYLLGYTPQVEHRDGKLHRLTVRVNRPGLTVRARQGYYAPRPERRNARETKPEQIAGAGKLSSAAIDALQMPLSMNGLTLDLFAAPFRAASGKNATVLVGAQVRGRGLVLGRGERMEIGFVGMNTDGKTSPGAFHIVRLDLTDHSRQVVEGSGLPFVDRLQLAPGRHQVKFVAHQPTGQTGMVLVDVDVPKFSDAPLSMSGVVLASFLELPQTAVKRDDPLLRLL